MGSSTITGNFSDLYNIAVLSFLNVTLVSVSAEVADERSTVSRLEMSVSPLDSDFANSCCAVLNLGSFEKNYFLCTMHNQSEVEALEMIENVHYEYQNASAVGTPIGNGHNLHNQSTSYYSWLQLFGALVVYLESLRFVLKN